MKLEVLMQNPYAWAILSVCTVLSLVFGLVSWITGRRKKQISYTATSHELIKNNCSTIPKLIVLFDNQEIENLTATQITLWNSGNTPIRREDIVDTKPLTLTALSSTRILDVQIMKQNEESNNFSAVIRDGAIAVDFNYMDRYEGAVLQVYHTGTADGLTLTCKIIGGKEPRREETDQKKYDTVTEYLIIGISLIIMLIFNTLFSILLSPVSTNSIVYGLGVEIIPLLIMLIISLLLGKNRKKLFHIGTPDSLK